MLYHSIKVSFLRKEQGERTTSNHKTEKRSKSESLTQSSTCFVSSFGLICLHPLAPLPRARSGAGASSRPPITPVASLLSFPFPQWPHATTTTTTTHILLQIPIHTVTPRSHPTVTSRSHPTVTQVTTRPAARRARGPCGKRA